MNDPVNHPSHYADNCSIECIEAMYLLLGEKGFVNFCIGNAFKYIWRHKYKNNPEEDLAKAEWYIKEVYELVIDVSCWPELNDKFLHIAGLVEKYKKEMEEKHE